MSSSQEPLAPIDANRKLVRDGEDPFNPLSERNTKPAPSFAMESKQHSSLHKRLMNQEKSGTQAGTYVSPSDDIMSPASAKLNAFKEKRFAKSTRPKTLFTKVTPLNSAMNLHDVPGATKSSTSHPDRDVAPQENGRAERS